MLGVNIVYGGSKMAIVKRGVISIDQDKCVGCGLCASACMQGAIYMENGKAHLADEEFCDGIGMCIPNCPTGAIIIEQKEVKEFDQTRANAKMRKDTEETGDVTKQYSSLAQWPVQIQLVSPNAPWLKDANLLICADCVPSAYANFHQELLKGKKMLQFCPKLDNGENYTQAIINVVNMNNIKTITIARMEVPCCGGTEHYVREASKFFNKEVPIRVITFSVEDGEPLDETNK